MLTSLPVAVRGIYWVDGEGIPVSIIAVGLSGDRTIALIVDEDAILHKVDSSMVDFTNAAPTYEGNIAYPGVRS